MKKLLVVLIMAVVFVPLTFAASPPSSSLQEFSWSELKIVDKYPPVNFSGEAFFCHASGSTARCILANSLPKEIPFAVIHTAPGKENGRWVMVHTAPGGVAVEGNGHRKCSGVTVPVDSNGKPHWWLCQEGTVKE